MNNKQKRTRQNPWFGEFKLPKPTPPTDSPDVSPIFGSVSVTDVCIVRYKKLKGGKCVVRSRKFIRGLKTTYSPSGELRAEFTAKNGIGSLTGRYDKETARLRMDLKNFVPAGYAKGRNFKVLGYNISANVTNVTRRRNPLALG